ncbi:hypothetical protein ABE488_04915 [Luteimonas sp. TWI662]|uniref:hypothetical protein n=1 Tax=Luteimonas sp. TWI662 TaxID=3136789 RepID=UPI00320A0009
MAWPSVLAALALSACGQAQPPAAAALPATTAEAVATPAPRTANADDTAVEPGAPVGLPGGCVRDYLVTQYGDLAQLVGTWPGLPLADELGDDAATREVCARAAIGTHDAPAEFVAVCGVPDDAGHATTARIDLFALRADGARAVADARAHLVDFGSTGDVADVDVRRLGPHLHGFVIEDGFTAQGLTIGNTSLVLPDGDSFTVAASLRSSLDNLGAMAGCAERDDCPPDTGYDLTFELDVDARDAGVVAWPLRVREYGEACGRRIDRTYTVPFDAATNAWRVPPVLQRDGCA